MPIGRILNRFSRDTQIVDSELPKAVNYTMATFIATLIDFFMISYSSTQIIWILIGFYMIAIILLQRYYMYANREITRLKAVSLSPVVQNFTELTNGIQILRIFQKENIIKNDYFKAINDSYANQLT